MSHFQKAKDTKKDNVLAIIGLAQLQVKNGTLTCYEAGLG